MHDISDFTSNFAKTEGAKSRASKFLFMTIWFWNVCEKEYYSCDPVNAGFGQKLP